MYIYLSKKIAIPQGVKLRTLSWNGPQGWIACGGEGGLLKVLKLDPTIREGSTARGLAAPSSLSMNQSLDGHKQPVVCAVWNENYRKLTTSGANGLIIVWMLYKNMWYEEMINNRDESAVADMRWSGDGQKICIAYEDGMTIVGAVGGQRIWGQSMGKRLTKVEWSPDSRMILFGVDGGDIHMHDPSGGYLSPLNIYCLDNMEEGAELIGIDWYNGVNGYIEEDCPCLAFGYTNGRIQIMRDHADENPVLIDTAMRALHMKWNRNGSVLAVAGRAVQTMPDGSRRELCVVQFYNPWGQNVCVLKVPGPMINAISWSGDGLRLALAVEANIYFANIRPDYKWGYFANTVVYCYTKPDKIDTCVLFWNTNTKEKRIKYVKKVLCIEAAGDNCILITKTEEAGGLESQHIVILFDAIGTPLDSKYIEIEPLYVSMSATHVVIASDNAVYTWAYKEGGGVGRASDERLFHIDETPSNSMNVDPSMLKPTRDTVCCVYAGENLMLVGRESGTVQRYSLPFVSLEARYQLNCRPQMLDVNSDDSLISIVDIGGVLTFFDMSKKTKDGIGEHLDVERTNVWDMCWADDNPSLFCYMEKTKMYIFRNLEPEEPIDSAAYICKFNDLVVEGILMDEVMADPDNPDRDTLQTFETRTLRDTRRLLETVSLRDGQQYVADNPHPRLFRLLGEAALEKDDLGIATSAFTESEDYGGVRFVDKLRRLDSPEKRKAEIHAYFGRFDEAEKAYRQMDRHDLAIDLRARLGDWFRVLKLLQSTGVENDALLIRAYNEVGDYFAERHKWRKAVEYYYKARNSAALVDGYYYAEEYDSLAEMVDDLPGSDELLPLIGERLVTVGMSEAAVRAFLKAGEVKRAIDCSVYLNKWDEAIQLAERHSFTEIDGLLKQYASHLLEGERTLEAIELYRKGSHHADSAKLLMSLAREASAKELPVRAKKLYILAALEADAFGEVRAAKSLANGKGMSADDRLEGLLLDGDDDDGGADRQFTESAWRGAEAYHLFLTAQRQLYADQLDASMLTALRLRDFEDILPPRTIYSLIALTTFSNGYYGQCSKAFIKLEGLQDLTDKQRQEYEEMALSIFTKFRPRDKKSRSVPCPNTSCSEMLSEWTSLCPSCGTFFPFCIASGRTLRTLEDTVVCNTCKHRALERELRGINMAGCPLCHHV